MKSCKTDWRDLQTINVLLWEHFLICQIVTRRHLLRTSNDAACFCSSCCAGLLIPDCHRLEGSRYEAIGAIHLPSGRERQRRKPCHILMGGKH